MQGRKQTRIALAVIALLALVAICAGWRLFWFLTDDAFIAFRYISNSHLGFGYVWNAPPFRPVEGYTSFLWVVLLDIVWRATGIEPPVSANYISLIFACLTLIIGGLMVLKMNLREKFADYRLLFLTLILIAVISNRTFLAWTSSGLETAMFNFFLMLWVYSCLYLPGDSRRWLFGITTSASLLYLSRPDGLLFVLITTMLVIDAIHRRPHDAKSTSRNIISAAPLLIVPAHLIWRHAVYGAWLPNTYYAKTVAGRFWIQAGLRYFASFMIEYSLWVWLIALIVLFAIKVRHVSLSNFPKNLSITKIAVAVAVLGQFLYYTLVVGGDHFEYRVYSHLILLIFISFLWILNATGIKARRAVPLFCLFVILSWPVPWIHWAITHNLKSSKLNDFARVSVSDAVMRKFPPTPKIVLNYLRSFDDLQLWLTNHYICVRHHSHKNFALRELNDFPMREEGLALPTSEYPVLATGAVGVISWVLPKINLIDEFGFNDYAIARNPAIWRTPLMAHERSAPAGYIECFEPNVTVKGKQVTIVERPSVLSPDKIHECELRYAKLVNDLNAGGSESKRPPVFHNPIDDPEFFLTQQYFDFLNRPPDPAGYAFWMDQLNRCDANKSLCRANISLALFNSPEAEARGLFVYALHVATYGAPPRFGDFMGDFNQLENFDVDSAEEERALLLQDWVARDAFYKSFPSAMTPDEFVDRVFDNANLRPFTAERRHETEALRSGKTRADILGDIIGLDAFAQRERARSTILSEYFILLRHDMGENEYQALLDRLKTDERVGYRNVTCVLLTNPDYQSRFGSVTRNNAECGQ